MTTWKKFQPDSSYQLHILAAAEAAGDVVVAFGPADRCRPKYFSESATIPKETLLARESNASEST